MSLESEITRITAEIQRHKDLEKNSHARWVELSRTLSKLKTQSKHVDKLLSSTKVEETNDGHN